MLEQILEAFAILFVTIDPVGTAVYFAAASGSSPAHIRSKVALKTVLVAFGILLAFGLGGDDILRAVGVRLFSLKIAGGIMLFLFGLGMVMGPPEQSGEEPGRGGLEEQAVFPLAMPLTAGPAAILSMVVLVHKAEGDYPLQAVLLLVMAAVMLITFLLLFASGWISRVLGKQGSEVFKRVLGLLLAALAVDMIFDGLTLAGIFQGG
jgi:multiple antibiotic resistance protein